MEPPEYPTSGMNIFEDFRPVVKRSSAKLCLKNQ